MDAYLTRKPNALFKAAERAGKNAYRSDDAGLNGEQLLEVVSQITSADTSGPQRRKLLRTLNPIDSVPSECAVQLMGAFAFFDGSTRKLALKWIALVLPWFDNLTIIHQLYAVFFHYIEFEQTWCASRLVLIHVSNSVLQRSCLSYPVSNHSA